MNNVNLTGNLTKEIELKKTNNQVSVCQFSIGVRRNFKNDKGEYDTDFVNCVAWRQSADFLSLYAHKGDKLGIVGSIQTRTYDKDGAKRWITEILVDKVEILHQVAEKTETLEEKAKQFAEDNNATFTLEEASNSDNLPFY